MRTIYVAQVRPPSHVQISTFEDRWPLMGLLSTYAACDSHLLQYCAYTLYLVSRLEP